VELKRVLKPDGSIIIAESNHGAFYCYPHSTAAIQVVDCLIRSQALASGNSLLGRELHPPLKKTGFDLPVVFPNIVNVDSSKPELVERFSKNTFTAMIEGVREKALALNLIDETTFDDGIRGLYRATAEDGTFCYTFFRGIARKED